MHLTVDKIISTAKSQIKTIVLPESNDIRVLKAAVKITQEKIAKIILIGNKDSINIQSKNLNLDFSQIEIVDPSTCKDTDQLANELFELRKEKGLTLEGAHKLLEDPIYFGTMLVKTGLADGMVAGAITATSDTFRPALQIIKTAPQHHIVSSFFIMTTDDQQFGQEGLLLFADCALNLDPNSSQLAEIAIQTGDSFRSLTNTDPKIALLSYSTLGSGQGQSVDKVRDATKIASNLRPDLLFEGEIQADTAINPETCSIKYPESKIKGSANVLIFPDLNSANIGYKLVQRLGKLNAFGPISQGLNKPINDLSRGCSVEDIVITTAITSIQSANANLPSISSPETLPLQSK